MGMFVGSFLCAFGLIMLDSCKYLIADGLDAAGSYEYQYYLNSIETEELKAGEPMLSVNFEVEGQASLFTLSGLVKEPQYLNLKTESGKEMEYGKYYMTSNAAALYGVKAGDEFTFINILSTKEYTVEVADIIDDNTQCVLYTSKSNVAQLLGAPEGGYNVVLSDKELSLDKDKIYLENSKDNLKAQLENTIQLIMSFIYLLLAFGAILCIISVYLTVNMLIEENLVNISMLKVLGYRKKEINSLILNTNHILLPISFVLSIWMCIELCKIVFEAFIAEMNVYIEPTITITSILICLFILVLSYFVSLSMLKHKVYQVDMVESLKDNRD